MRINRDFARAIVVQANGKILVGGEIGDNLPYSDTALLRVNPDGSLDQSFGVSGKVITDNTQLRLSGIVLQPDGKILTTGGVTGDGVQISYVVSRCNSNGTLDLGFGNGGFAKIGAHTENIVVSESEALLLQPDGKILAVGYANIAPGGERFLITRFNSDGSPDQSFGVNGSVFTRFTNGTTHALAVALQTDGKIVAAGFNVADQVTRNFALARYNPNGSIDLNFGLEGMVTTNFNFHNFAKAHGVVIQPDGKIIAVGGFTKNTRTDFCSCVMTAPADSIRATAMAAESLVRSATGRDSARRRVSKRMESCSSRAAFLTPARETKRSCSRVTTRTAPSTQTSEQAGSSSLAPRTRAMLSRCSRTAKWSSQDRLRKREEAISTSALPVTMAHSSSRPRPRERRTGRLLRLTLICH